MSAFDELKDLIDHIETYELIMPRIVEAATATVTATET